MEKIRCSFLRKYAQWPAAEKIVLVQDNLNTHNTSSFYENLPAADAFALAQQFEMHYTPKKGSWLNIAELELSALSRICLGRRIASLEKLDHEMQALVKERNEQKCKVTWQFSLAHAREKLKRHYDKVKPTCIDKIGCKGSNGSRNEKTTRQCSFKNSSTT